MREGSATILIVDDQPQNNSSLETLLVADGYQVLTAEGGIPALKLLAEEQVDLVLLDIVMPGMDGFEVLRRIRAQPQGNVPILLVSARYTDSGDAARGLEIGADDYILKPFDLAELKARIASQLRQRRLEQELREARQQAEEQSDLLRRTLGIVRTAASSLDPDSLASTIHRGLHSELQVTRAAIWRSLPEGIPRSLPADAAPLPPSAWETIVGGGAIVQHDGRLLLPMRISGDLEGVLDVERAGAWCEGAIPILKALSDSLAILFQNTRYMRHIARENTFHELLNRLASQDAPLQEMLVELRQFLNTHLLLVDRWFNLLVSEALPEMVEDGQLRASVVKLYQAQGIMENVTRRRRTVVVEGEDSVPFHRIFPVVLGGEVTALLVTVPTEGTHRSELAPEGELERAARFLAGVLQRQREAALREQNLRADFLNDFLSGRQHDDLSRPALFLRANALGLNLAQPGFVAQVELPGFDQLVDWSQPLFDQRVSELLSPLVRDAQRARETLNLEGIEVVLGERVVAIITLPRPITEEQARQKAMLWAQRLLDSYHHRSSPQNERPAIGLGRLAFNWHELLRSANEAERALRWVIYQTQSPVAYYGDLGSERLLAAVADRAELTRFHDEQLGPVIAYDDAREGDLIRSLDAFYANGGQIARAAQSLAVHPNTLKYRLDQIAQLTGRDPRSPAVALDIQLALKIHGML